MKSFGLLAALLIGCNQTPPPPQQAAPQKVPQPASKQSTLAVDDVLRWRTSYGDLLGKSKDAAVDRFGQPSTEDRPGTWTWDASAKTDNRMVTISYKDGPPRDATQVKVYASESEKLDPLEVLKRAPQFNFATGTYKDSVTNYLVVETKDGRNDLQFDVDGNVTFSAAIFRK